MTTISNKKGEILIDQQHNSLAVKCFAMPVAILRDIIARGLGKIGITPNALTIAGTVFTLIAGCFLARGSGQSWLQEGVPASFWAGCWLFLACAMDMLDGAVARSNNMHTKFGGILDSTGDRISDIAIFGGICIGYDGNATFQLLALVGLTNAVLTSYIKARAEHDIDSCSVGFWQRGERMAGVLAACFAGHIGTLVVMMALLPAFTVVARLRHCFVHTRRETPAGVAAVPTHFWQPRRSNRAYVFACAVCILILVLVRVEPIDLLRSF
jgi:phosphatidylglycerophosphate synthase